MSRRRLLTRTSRASTAVIVFLAMLAGLLSIAPTASAVGSPVMIDDFDGTVRGTRTVTALPLPGTSTTAPGTFAQVNGLGTIQAGGNGNGVGGIQLDYGFPATDLTAGGSNTQFFLEFASIQRLPEQSPGETAASITVEATDTNGAKGTYNTGIANVFAFNVVFNFACAANQSACFKPAIDFGAVSKVSVQVRYPQNLDADQSLTAQLDTIRTTPTGGVVPAPPTPTVTAPAGSSLIAPGGAFLDFPVAFVSSGEDAPVTHTPITDDGLLAGGVTASGTAAGSTQVASITGGPSAYVVRIGPLTSSGTVAVQIPAGQVQDAWGQLNVASNKATVTFTVAVPPVFTSGPPPAGRRGTAYSFQFAAGGTPAAAYAATPGALPAGVTLTSAGLLSGTPSAAGRFTFEVTASNVAGSVKQSITLDVNAPPAITSASTANFQTDQTGTFTVTTTGYPRSTIALTGSLPAGLSYLDKGDGTATISGRPTAGGTATVTLTASNGISPVATQTLTISSAQPPAITSPNSVTFDFGAANTFTVTTTGTPAPAISVLQGALPTGLALTDNGDGTATLSGTPSGNAATTTVTLRAGNGTAPADQILTIVIRSKPRFLTPATLSVVQDQAVVFSVVTEPAGTISATDLPAGLSLQDNGDGTATILGTPSGPAGTATAHLTATNGAGSASQDLIITVQRKPRITSGNEAIFLTGVDSTFTITTDGDPDATISPVAPLPAGLTFVEQPGGRAIITGSATGPAGSTTVTVEATNPAGATVQQLTIIVRTPPAFTSAASAGFTVGVGGSFTITTSGSPAPAISSSPLPAGLTLTDQGDGTATLSGTPTGPGGAYPVTLTGFSLAGSVQQTLTITISRAPAFTSPATAVFKVGTFGSYAVTTAGFPPAAITSGALPAGLVLNDLGNGTAVITGTPTGPPSVTPVTLHAENASGLTDQVLTVTVNSAANRSLVPERDQKESVDTKKSGGTLVSPQVTTKQPNELVLALINANGPRSGDQSVTSVSGGGLTWTLAVRNNTRPGTSEIWQAYAPGKLAKVKVTAKLSKAGHAATMTIATFEDARSQVGVTAVASGQDSKPRVSLIPSASSSVLWGTARNLGSTKDPKAVSGQSVLHKYDVSKIKAAYWSQRTKSAPKVGVSASLADTKPTSGSWRYAAVEVLSSSP